MLTDWLFESVLWILGGVLDGLTGLIPPTLLDWFTNGIQAMSGIMAVGPMSSVLVLMSAWFLLDTALNAASFGLEAYRLIPFKAS